MSDWTYLIILSKAQGRALNKLMDLYEASPRKSATPYDLKERFTTLDALVTQGFASRTLRLGYITNPRLHSFYRITAYGREALPHVDVPS